MKCLRCNYEWDVREGPCPRCKLRIRAPGQSGVAHRVTRDPLLDNSISPPPASERPAQVQPRHQLDVAGEKPAQLQFPTPANEVRLPRQPATDSLDPKRVISPLQNVSYPLNPRKTPPRVSSPVGHDGIQSFPVGTLLHRNRYRLQKVMHRQEWPLGIVETVWSAIDTRLANAAVIIHELSIAETAPREAQAIPYTATKVFTSIGSNPHILPVRDVFSDKGRNFFVFEPVEGLSVMALMSNNRGILPEHEAITCCEQIVDLLDVCLRQVPPLIHGNIRPEYVVRKSTASHYVLTNFSVALAGGLAQIVVGKDLEAFNSELMKGKMDGPADLFALLALTYYALTGHRLSGINTLVTSGDLPAHLHKLFAKGLLAPRHQRYQTPSELHRDLLVLHKEYEHVSPVIQTALVKPRIFSSPPSVQSTPQEHKEDHVPTSQPIEEYLEHTLLVPHPEELPPLKEGHDMLAASLWFVGMFVCFMLLLGHGLL